MLRIISDAYVKENKRIWGTDPTTKFNQKILAVNNMYGWLYNQGLLEKVCFEFKDYSDGVEFALDVKDLEPYRSEMEACGIDGATLAVRHIFDEPYTPCTYSGAIELGWTMQGYRSVDGMVGRSWECGLSQDLNTEGIYAVAKVREEQGVKAAVKEMFAQLDWELTLPEQKVYEEALKYFGKDVATNIENDFVKDHARELIFCYDNGKTLIDFDFWTQYETLLAEKITYEEYRAIDGDYEDDPLDIDPSDKKTIVELKNILDNYRSKIESSPKNKETKPSIDSQIHSASTRSGTLKEHITQFVFTPNDYETAKADLLSSGKDIIGWRNEGYICQLERSEDDEIYYDLHLTDSGTTVMYGEVVEVLEVDRDLIKIRVPDDEKEFACISKAFFDKNFSPSVTKEQLKAMEPEPEL